MSKPTPISVIALTISSERDIYGNCYHMATFWNTKKGRQESVTLEVGGSSNAEHIAFRLAGGDWEKTLFFKETLPKREFQRYQKHKAFHYEGSEEAKAALLKLFGRDGTSGREQV